MVPVARQNSRSRNTKVARYTLKEGLAPNRNLEERQAMGENVLQLQVVPLEEDDISVLHTDFIEAIFSPPYPTSETLNLIIRDTPREYAEQAVAIL